MLYNIDLVFKKIPCTKWMMGNGITIQTWLVILELKIIFLDIQLWILHQELFQKQRKLTMTSQLTDTHQRLEFYTREIPTELARDPKPAASTVTKSDHMSRLQVKLAAVSIPKVVWANKTCNDSMNMSKPNQLTKSKVKEHKCQDHPLLKAMWNLKFPKPSHKLTRNWRFIKQLIN